MTYDTDSIRIVDPAVHAYFHSVILIAIYFGTPCRIHRTAMNRRCCALAYYYNAFAFFAYSKRRCDISGSCSNIRKKETRELDSRTIREM